jgi:hypothetical protein
MLHTHSDLARTSKVTKPEDFTLIIGHKYCVTNGFKTSENMYTTRFHFHTSTFVKNLFLLCYITLLSLSYTGHHLPIYAVVEGHGR